MTLKTDVLCVRVRVRTCTCTYVYIYIQGPSRDIISSMPDHKMVARFFVFFFLFSISFTSRKII